MEHILCLYIYLKRVLNYDHCGRFPGSFAASFARCNAHGRMWRQNPVALLDVATLLLLNGTNVRYLVDVN
jgi:hypothetical protein